MALKSLKYKRKFYEAEDYLPWSPDMTSPKEDDRRLSLPKAQNLHYGYKDSVCNPDNQGPLEISYSNNLTDSNSQSNPAFTTAISKGSTGSDESIYPPKKRIAIEIQDPKCDSSAENFLHSLEAPQTTQEICMALINMAFWRPEVQNRKQDTDGHVVAVNTSECDVTSSNSEISHNGIPLHELRIYSNAINSTTNTAINQFGRLTAANESFQSVQTSNYSDKAYSSVYQENVANSTSDPQICDRPSHVSINSCVNRSSYVKIASPCVPRDLRGHSGIDSTESGNPDLHRSRSTFTDAESCELQTYISDSNCSPTYQEDSSTSNDVSNKSQISDVTSVTHEFIPNGANSVEVHSPLQTAHSPLQSPTGGVSSPETSGKSGLFPKPCKSRQLVELVKIMARRHHEDYFIDWSADKIETLGVDERPLIYPVTAELRKDMVSKSVVTENKKLAFAWYSEDDWGHDFRRKLRNGVLKTLSEAKRAASLLWREHCPKYDSTRAVRVRDNGGNIVMKRTRAESGTEFEYRQNLRKAKVNTVVQQIWTRRAIIAEVLASSQRADVTKEIEQELPGYKCPDNERDRLADIIAYTLKKDLLSMNDEKTFA